MRSLIGFFCGDGRMLACQPEPTFSGGSTFDLDKFEQNIINTYSDKVV